MQSCETMWMPRKRPLAGKPLQQFEYDEDECDELDTMVVENAAEDIAEGSEMETGHPRMYNEEEVQVLVGWKELELEGVEHVNQLEFDRALCSFALALQHPSIPEARMAVIHEMRAQVLMMRACDVEQLSSTSALMVAKERCKMGFEELTSTRMHVREMEEEERSRSQRELARHLSWHAVNEAEAATRVNPEWARGWQTLGRALVNYGDLRAAVRAFERSIEVVRARYAGDSGAFVGSRERGVIDCDLNVKEDDMEVCREIQSTDLPHARFLLHQQEDMALDIQQIEEEERARKQEEEARAECSVPQG